MVADGPANPALLERLWRDFARAPVVKAGTPASALRRCRLLAPLSNWSSISVDTSDRFERKLHGNFPEVVSFKRVRCDPFCAQTKPSPRGTIPACLGPFVLAAPENTAGEMPAWLATASSGGRPYVCRLQALPMALAIPAGTARRIQSATRGLRRLPGTNLATGLGLAVVDQRLLLAERPTPGVSLADLMPGAFPAEAACLIVQQLARALAALRRRGLDTLVAGRLAPARVRIGWSGTVAAAGRRAGRRPARGPAGTGASRCAHPSLASRRRREDVRALGVLLWELLAGQGFGTTTANVSADQSARRRSDLPRGLPPQLYAVIAQALAPQPDQRFPSAKALSRALDDFAPGRWRGRRCLRRLLARRMDVDRGRREQAASLQAAARVLAAHATTAGTPVAFSIRRWPLVWATAITASALAAVALLSPVHCVHPSRWWRAHRSSPPHRQRRHLSPLRRRCRRPWHRRWWKARRS